MTESETEAEIMARLEVALRRIAAAAHAPRRPGPVANAPGIDRDALVHALDTLIVRLRAGLKPAAHFHVSE